MNILIVGSGGREHAIAKALQASKDPVNLFCCGSNLNPGIQQLTDDFWIGDINDKDAILTQCRLWNICLAIIGPEAPLEAGLADALWQAAIPTIGPKKTLAQIETSKSFARKLMSRHQIPGVPNYRFFKALTGVREYLHELGENNYVIKADSLMGGKGVKVAGDHLTSIDDAFSYCETLQKNNIGFLIEEKLVGQEFSFMCFCDGEHIVPMPIVQDHKRAYLNDQGPNTGGMGSYTNADHSLPFLTAEDESTAWQINKAVIKALQADCEDRYVGILYGGFIATRKGIYVIEFNARFGDPEALNVLSILKSDFFNICKALVTGNLSSQSVTFSNQATVCKYAVPEGYPDRSIQSALIDVSAVKNKSHLYLASLNLKDGKMLTAGSRTLAYVGVGETISAAEQIAETEISAVRGPLFHRGDIGTEAMIDKKIEAMTAYRSNSGEVP